MLKGFRKFFADQARANRDEMCLGNPLPTYEARERRLTNMASLTDGRGFRVPKKALRTDAQGQTRGERKRALRAALLAKTKEFAELGKTEPGFYPVMPEYMHSAARRRMAGGAA